MEKRFFIGCVGLSAGGLDALIEFFSNIDKNVAAAFVVISHLPADSTTYTPKILSKVAPINVELLDHNIVPEPGNIYVLPGNLRVRIVDGELIVRKRKPEEKVNWAIDEFLFSLAEDQQKRAVAVILSGMGSDGSEGAKAIHDHGGSVLVQSPASSPYESMPKAVIHKDNPNGILAPHKLAQVFMQKIESEA